MLLLFSTGARRYYRFLGAKKKYSEQKNERKQLRAISLTGSPGFLPLFRGQTTGVRNP